MTQGLVTRKTVFRFDFVLYFKISVTRIGDKKYFLHCGEKCAIV
jgi:hypothetical protein